MQEHELTVNLDSIPGDIIAQSNSLAKKLFGPSIDSIGESLIEDVKKRQLINELSILSKVQQILKDTDKRPGKVPLKVLVPLISQSSCEEDETLQDKWARLISHILTEETDIIFSQNCISILNRISSDDAKLLDKLHDELNIKRQERFTRRPTVLKNPIQSPNEYRLDLFSFGVRKISRELNIPYQALEFSLANLITLGLLKWETDVEISAEKAYDDPEDKDIEVDVTVSNNDDFIFTSLGDKFVTICKNPLNF